MLAVSSARRYVCRRTRNKQTLFFDVVVVVLSNSATRTDNLPPFRCYGGDLLPKNVSEYSSYGFGGPQNSVTGEVTIYGDDFLLADEENVVDQYVAFFVRQPSYVRFFTRAGDDDDIDFFLYKNNTQYDVISSSNALGAVESALFYLEPQPEAYILNVYFFNVATEPPCRRFAFEMVVKTATRVHNELVCPSPLPNAATRMPPQVVVAHVLRCVCSRCRVCRTCCST